MSKTLKAASAAAIAMYMIATLAMTDTSAAFATAGKAETSTPLVAVEALELVQVAVIDSEIEQTKVAAKSLTELVSAQPRVADLGKEANCLASAVFFEAKGESLEGQLAVAKVVLARRDSNRFPSSICGVVRQPGQFSFVRGGRIPAIRTGTRGWRNAAAIAQIALSDHWQSPVEGALFFHARYVSPGWRLQRMAAVDNHIFYR